MCGEHGGMGQDHIGLVLGPKFLYPSMHEREGIQDLHPLVHEHVELHSDGDTDGSDELFCLVPASVETLGLGCSSTSGGVAPSQHVHQDCLCYSQCGLCCGI